MKKIVKIIIIAVILIACLLMTTRIAKADTVKSKRNKIKKYNYTLQINVRDKNGKPARTKVKINGKTRTVKGRLIIKKKSKKMPSYRVKCKGTADKKATSGAYIKKGTMYISANYNFTVKKAKKRSNKLIYYIEEKNGLIEEIDDGAFNKIETPLPNLSEIKLIEPLNPVRITPGEFHLQPVTKYEYIIEEKRSK